MKIKNEVTLVNGVGWHLRTKVTIPQEVDICERNRHLYRTPLFSYVAKGAWFVKMHFRGVPSSIGTENASATQSHKPKIDHANTPIVEAIGFTLGLMFFYDILPQWRCFSDPGSGPEGISLFLVGNSALLPLHHWQETLWQFSPGSWCYKSIKMDL